MKLNMKKFILTLAVALFGFAAQAQEQPTEGAKIQFAEKVINYGKIEKGANGTRVFKFKNEGTEPLVLNSVRALVVVLLQNGRVNQSLQEQKETSR